MNKRPFRFFLCLSVFAAVIGIFCANPPNPFSNSENATISLFLKDSNGNFDSLRSLTDTVADTVKVGICPYLYEFVDSATVTISDSQGAVDTSFVFRSFDSDVDTQWTNVFFSKIGKYAVVARARIQGNKLTNELTARIIVVGKRLQILTQPTSATKNQDSSLTLSVQAAGTPPFTYQWLHNSVAISSGGTGSALFIKQLTATDSGVYICIVKDQWGDSTVTAPAVVTVISGTVVKPNSKPILSVTGRLQILSTQTCSLTVSAADPDSGQSETIIMTKGPSGAVFASPLFTWAPPAGYLGTDTMRTDTAIFTVIDNGHPPLSDTQRVPITVSLRIAPKISAKLSDQTLNKGDSLVLTVTLSQNGFPVPKYYWFKNTPPALDSTTTNSWKKLQMSLADSGYYYVIVKNAVGQDSSGCKVTMQCAPVLSTKLAAATTVNAGATTPLSVSANLDATPAPIYKWYFNGTQISAATSASYSKIWTGTDSGAYKVIVSNSAGTDSSVTKLVVNAPPAIQTPPSPLQILEHQSISLSVSANGTLPLTYQWRKNNVNIQTNATAQTYVLTNATTGDSGNYSAIVSNAFGSCTSSTAHVTVLPTFSLTTASVPAAGGSISRSKDTAFYPLGDTVTLTAAAATGYRFTGWSGDLTGTSSPAKIAINAAKNVTANFIKQFSLGITVPQGGTVTKTPNQTMYDSNSVVTLNVQNALGYNFYEWTGDTTTKSQSMSVTMNSSKNFFVNIIRQFNWTVSNTGLTDTIVKAFAVNGNIIYAGTADSGVYRSANYGVSWNKMDTGLFDFNVTSLACLGSIVFAGTDSGVFRSNDSAKTWMITDTSTRWGGWGCGTLAIKGTGLYAGTLAAMYFSPDSGKTWSQVQTTVVAGSAGNISVFGNTILLGDRSTIKRSQDNGASWYTVLYKQYLGARTFAFNGNNLFAGSTGYGLFRSPDTGTTWTQVDSTIHAWALTSYGTSIFAGNGSSDIFVSIDNGDHWFPQNCGLNAQAFAILNKTIFVGTNGGTGLYTASLP